MNVYGAVSTHIVLGSFPIAVMKYTNKSSLRKEGLTLAHSSTCSPSRWRGKGSRSLKQLLTVGPQSECDECMHASILVTFPTICSPGFPCPGSAPAQS